MLLSFQDLFLCFSDHCSDIPLHPKVSGVYLPQGELNTWEFAIVIICLCSSSRGEWARYWGIQSPPKVIFLCSYMVFQSLFVQLHNAYW